MYHQWLALQPDLRGAFSQFSPFLKFLLSDDSRLCQVDIKLTGTVYKWGFVVVVLFVCSFLFALFSHVPFGSVCLEQAGRYTITLVSFLVLG